MKKVKQVTLEQFKNKMETFTESEIIDLMPAKIDLDWSIYKLSWTENNVRYSNELWTLRGINIYSDLKQTLIDMCVRLVENKHLNLTLIF